jgi:hypothetical protein
MNFVDKAFVYGILKKNNVFFNDVLQIKKRSVAKTNL